MVIVEQPSLTETLPRRRWTRDEYYRMAEAGILRPDERVELIDGEVVQKVSPQNPPHANSTVFVSEALREAFNEGHHVRVQVPILIGSSEPEPDVAVIVGNPRDYSDHPTTAVLVVEVAQSTLAADRGAKANLYASAAVPEYWVLNLIDRQLEVHRDPIAIANVAFGHAYRTRIIYRSGESVRPLARPDAEVAVDALLPRLG